MRIKKKTVIIIIITLAAVTHTSPNLSGSTRSRSFLTHIVVQWEYVQLGSLPCGHLGTETPHIPWLCLSLNHGVSKCDPKTLRSFQTVSTRFPLSQLFVCEGLDFFCVLRPKQHTRWNIKACVRICLLLS